jgi:hypothetical protein
VGLPETPPLHEPGDWHEAGVVADRNACWRRVNVRIMLRFINLRYLRHCEAKALSAFEPLHEDKNLFRPRSDFRWPLFWSLFQCRRKRIVSVSTTTYPLTILSPLRRWHLVPHGASQARVKSVVSRRQRLENDSEGRVPRQRADCEISSGATAAFERPQQ